MGVLKTSVSIRLARPDFDCGTIFDVTGCFGNNADPVKQPEPW